MIKNNIYINECKKHKGILMFIMVLLLAETYVVFKIPFKMEAMNNLLFNLNKESKRAFIICFFSFICFNLVQVGIFFVLNITYKKLSNSITESIVQKLIKKIYFAKIKFPSQFKTDELMQTVNGDAYRLGDNGIKIIFQIIRITINTVGLLFYMSITNVYLAGLIIFNLLIIMFIQNRLNIMIAKKLKILKKTYGEYAYTSNTFFGRFNEYRYVGAESYFTKHINNDLQKYLDDSLSIEKISSANAVFGMISTLINTMIIMGVGAWMLTQGKLTLAALVTFSTYAGVFGGYITSIPGVFMQLKEFGISYERVDKIMKAECHDDEMLTDSLDNYVNTIQLSDVSFAYEASKKIIKDYSYEFEKNKIYCIVGENGAGKTTLINILLGEYELSDGLIEINGNPVKLYDCMNKYREHVSYCPSSRLFFNDSVKNNILLDRKYEEEKIMDIMKKLRLDNDPGLSLSREVDTMHGNLSDGQMQKISIVRSVLDNKEVMIFDEPEMHLDQDTKKNVMQYLNAIKWGKIIILISHDNYVVKHSDVIVDL